MDKRYTITLEWCGQSSQKYIARFCGDWLGWGDNKGEAREVIAAHISNRD